MNTYQYILLDWDGNLAKTLDVWMVAVRQAMEKRGIVLTDDEIAASFGAVHEYFTKWGVQDMAYAIEDMDAYAKEHLPNAELYPDALHVLESLKERDRQMALITTSPHYLVDQQLETHNMSHLFDVIIANEDTEHHKPHPEPLERALEQLGGTKDRAVMIGDSNKDLGAGVNAGVDTILFYPPEHKKFYKLEELKELHPTHIVEDFRKVLDII